MTDFIKKLWIGIATVLAVIVVLVLIARFAMPAGMMHGMMCGEETHGSMYEMMCGVMSGMMGEGMMGH